MELCNVNIMYGSTAREGRGLLGLLELLRIVRLVMIIAPSRLSSFYRDITRRGRVDAAPFSVGPELLALLEVRALAERDLDIRLLWVSERPSPRTRAWDNPWPVGSRR